MNGEHNPPAGVPRTARSELPSPFAYTIEQAMALLNIDRRRIYAMIADGSLRTYKHGRRRFASAEALRDCVHKLERVTA